MGTEDYLHFINREEELQTITDSVIALSNGSYDGLGVRFFEYVGIAGVGKTTLLHAISEKCFENEIQSFYIDFDLYNNNDGHGLIDWVKSKTTKFLFEEKGEQVSTLEGFVDDISQSLPKKSLVILLDSLDAIDDESLELIALNIVLPIIDGYHVLVFSASQKNIDWGKANSRIRNRFFKRIQLRPFSEPASIKQLSTSGYESIAKNIHKLSGGNPGGNFILLDALKEIEQLDSVIIDNESFGDYEYRLISVLKREWIDKDVKIPEKYFRACQILSILRLVDFAWPKYFDMQIDNRDWKLGDSAKLMIEMMDYPEMQHVFYLDMTSRVIHMNSTIRIVLSTLLRFSEPDIYAELTKEAIDYYRERFQEPEKKELYIIEMLYHISDYVRMEENKWDVEIAKDLKISLVNSLRSMLPELYSSQEVFQEGEEFQFSRRRSISKIGLLRTYLDQDELLAERVGDRNSPNFLVETVDDFIKNIESLDQMNLRISFLEIDENHYDFTFTWGIAGRSADKKFNKRVSRNRISKIYEYLLDISDFNDVKKLGNFIRATCVPKEMQTILFNNDSPILISTDNNPIPWELFYDGNSFLSQRVALGRRLALDQLFEPITQNRQKSLRILLVGISETMVSGYADKKLLLAREEIKNLAKIFSGETFEQKHGQIDFDFDRDVLLDEEALGSEFISKLSSGDYQIIHYAGHAKTANSLVENQSDRKEYQYSSSSNFGLVLYDEIVSGSDIRDALTSTPMIFLNACKTGINMGIGQDFIRAGASACISTLWDINDSLAVEFAEIFYKNLFDHKNIGDSLVLSRKHIINQMPASSIWASYMLFGNPNLRLVNF